MGNSKKMSKILLLMWGITYEGRSTITCAGLMKHSKKIQKKIL